MHLGQSYPTTTQAHFSNALQLAPPTLAVLFIQPITVTDAHADCDSFNISNLADDVEVHRGVLSAGGVRPLHEFDEASEVV